MNTVSFMGANLVAQQLDWSMSEGWSQGDTAANNHYRPLETFDERFRDFLQLAVDSGFSSVDVWTAQLHWAWATEQHRAIARQALDDMGVTVTSYAGSFGGTPAEFAAAASVATALGAPILSGNSALLASDRDAALRELGRTGLVLAIENHPEKDPEEIAEKIGDGARGVIGTAIDTGWWATQGYDAADAIRCLGPDLFHVHLKDIRASAAHDTCALGDGIVNVEACVRAIRGVGFSGPISIEHEPEHYDPMPEVVLSRKRLEVWLAASWA